MVIRAIVRGMCSALLLASFAACVNTGTVSATRLRAWFDPGYLYTIPAHVGGAKVMLLVDTGSDTTTLRASRVKALRHKHYVRDSETTIADGRRIMLPVYIIPVMSFDGCRLTDVKVTVVPDDAIELLGVRTLRRLAPVTFQPEGMTATCPD